MCSAAITRLLKEEISVRSRSSTAHDVIAGADLGVALQELFARPVNPEEDGCPDYLEVIKHPIDLGTIRDRVDSGFYEVSDLLC